MLNFKKYKVIFFGSSEFGLPSLELLLKKKWKVVSVITQPDRPKGRALKPSPTPVKVFAKKNKLPVLEFDNLGSPEGRAGIMHHAADIAVVASYGQLIPEALFNAARLGFLNLHPSLLPRYRGPAPIQYALLNGEKKTGVSVILLDDKMDHGPIIAQETTPILPDDDYPALHDRLASQAAALLLKTLPAWIVRDIKPQPQDDKQATYTKLITKDDGRVVWKNTAAAVVQKIKAFTPWPEAWTTFEGERFKILKAEIALAPVVLLPGEIRVINDDLYAGCGNQTVLRLLTVQPAGGKAMSARAYLRGHPEAQGKTFV